MAQVDQDLEGLVNDVVGPPAFDVYHKPHPTRLMFELRVV
jgi:hypothetical protein